VEFYNRTNELAELKRIQSLAFNDCSRLTVVTGRRRIGKTSLIMRSVGNLPTVYLFVGRKSEATLFVPSLFLLSVNHLMHLFLQKFAHSDPYFNL